jgi:hypothetical protein
MFLLKKDAVTIDPGEPIFVKIIPALNEFSHESTRLARSASTRLKILMI